MSLRGPVDITVQKPAPGQPLSASNVTIAPRTPAPTNTVDIPPPQLVAPWVYAPPSKAGNYFQNNQTNYFNGPGGHGNVPGPSTSAPVTPPPALPPVQTPPALPPVQPPPSLPPAPPIGNQPPPMPPQQQPPAPPTPPPPPPTGEKLPVDPTAQPLDGQTVEQMNSRLENRNETVRADAAMDFFKMMESNPSLANDPKWSADINAFLVKIMHDPSPIVRQGALMTLEMGYVPHPDPQAMATLEELADKNGLFGIESDQAGNILRGIHEKMAPTDEAAPHEGHEAQLPQPEPTGQQLNLVSNQQDLLPAKGPGVAPPPSQLDITSRSPAALPAGGSHG